jgi:hypothetical protein
MIRRVSLSSLVPFASVAAILLFLGPTSNANAQAECVNYADEAVTLARENEILGCGYTGGRWFTRVNAHSEWCWKRSAFEIAAEGQARALAIQKCRSCTQYAVHSVEQNDTNNRRNCGGTGPRWHSDRGTHLRWCIGANPWDLQGEKSARQALLSWVSSNFFSSVWSNPMGTLVRHKRQSPTSQQGQGRRRAAQKSNPGVHPTGAA